MALEMAFALLLFYLIIFRVVPVPLTPLMLIREFPIKKHWVGLSDISPNLPKAAITSEDPKFLLHHGFDFEAIQKAMKENKRRKIKRGASTISQQLAKNLFLWPGRSWLRKGMEVPLTLAIEAFWTKRRIIEVYLNVIEMGKGIYGAGAASEIYFKKGAARLSAREAASLVSCFPLPLKWTPASLPSYMARKRDRTVRYMADITLPEHWYPRKSPPVPKAQPKRRK